MFTVRLGLTKLELIVVLSILMLLAGILVPAIQMARESARKSQCSNNLRQIGLAIQHHESAHQALPSLYNGDFRLTPLTVHEEFHCYSWRTAILPELEQNGLYTKLDSAIPPTVPQQQELVNQRLAVFECPSTPSPGSVRDILSYNGGGPSTAIVGTAARSDYEAVGGVGLHFVPGPRPPYLSNVEFGAWGEPSYRYVPSGLQPTSYRRARLRDIRDGLSTTFLLVERSGRPDWYVGGQLFDTHPYSKPKIGGDHHQAAWAISTHFPYLVINGDLGINGENMRGIYSFHANGANVLMADGSTQFIAAGTDTSIIKALATRAYNEAVTFPQ